VGKHVGLLDEGEDVLAAEGETVLEGICVGVKVLFTAVGVKVGRGEGIGDGLTEGFAEGEGLIIHIISVVR